MINNSYISLSKSSNIRNDAINSIKHTLLLNYESPKIEDISNPIPEIIKSCNKCCSELFQNAESIHNSYNTIYFDFFGTRNTTSKDKTKADCVKGRYKESACELSFLDMYTLSDTKIKSKNATKNYSNRTIGFPDMILDHCVLSCYHAVITDLLCGNSVTLYETTNNIGYTGFYSLYKSNRIDFQSERILKKSQNNQHINRKKSSSASDFSRIIETHFKPFPYLRTLFENNTSQEAARYYLQFSGLLSHICEIDARNFRLFSPKITDHNKNDVLKNFEDFSAFISNKKVEGNINPQSSLLRNNRVDELYYRHIIERIFNLNLFYSLLRNIHRIESQTDYRLCQKEIIEVLCLCQKLPNTFSRQYFLQYAFDKIITRPISYLDFWHEHILDLNNNVLESSTRFKTSFQFTKWIEQFEHFCNYMAEFVIPVYEWCFTNMVMEVMEQKVSIGSDQNNPADFHKRCLTEAMETLAEYMDENYNQITRPIHFAKYQDSLDIITKHKSGILDLNISADSLQNLFDVFYPKQRNLDLNLSHLNRNFFIHSGNGNCQNNLRHVRNFYLNLLYPN